MVVREFGGMSRNPFSATCGFVDWNGTGGAAIDRAGSRMAIASGFRTLDKSESAFLMFKFFPHCP